MFSKWTSSINSGTSSAPYSAPAQGSAPVGDGKSAEPVDNNFIIMLLYGKNSFGDKVYCYLQVMKNDLLRLRFASKEGQAMNPSDFGTILYAGRDEPSDEIKAEIASLAPVVNPDMMPLVTCINTTPTRWRHCRKKRGTNFRIDLRFQV